MDSSWLARLLTVEYKLTDQGTADDVKQACDLLNLPMNFSRMDVNKRYRLAALHLHPDKIVCNKSLRQQKILENNFKELLKAPHILERCPVHTRVLAHQGFVSEARRLTEEEVREEARKEEIRAEEAKEKLKDAQRAILLLHETWRRNKKQTKKPAKLKTKAVHSMTRLSIAA